MTKKNETGLVRVKDKQTGAHLTITQGRVDRNKDRYEVLKDHAAVDVNGKPYPPKPQQPKAEPVGQAKTTTPKKEA